MTSKSVWNLPGGPWERLFGGVWNKFNVAVYENGEKVLLTTIFPKSGEVSWIMVRVDKVLLAPRGIDKIEPQLRDRHMHILKQQVPGSNMAYIILLNPPSTLEFGSSEIGSNVFQKVMSLNKEADEIKLIAKNAKVELIDLKDAPYKESASILGNPTLLLSLLSIAPEGEEPRKEKLRELVIGENESGPFKIDESVFSGFVSIKKGTEEERNYLAQTLLEDSIIDASPIPIVMDFSRRPLKLDQPNPYPYDYSRYDLKSHNVSFRVRLYEMSPDGCEIKINLNHVSQQFIWKLFGVGNDEASTLILQAVDSLQRAGRADTISGIEPEVRKLALSGGKSKSVEMRAVRMLRAIDKVYGGLFSKDFDMAATVKEWLKKTETIYLPMPSLDNRKRLALIYYIIEGIEQLKSSSALSDIESKRLEHFFFAFIGMDWFGAGLLQSEIMGKMASGQMGAVFTADGDLPMQIESRVIHRFQILGAGKAKLFIGGRGTEFDVRPLLSCPP